MTLFDRFFHENDRQRDREREEKTSEKEREREQASWMPNDGNCRKQGTTG